MIKTHPISLLMRGLGRPANMLRAFICCAAAFANGMAVAFQGNDWLPSGFFIGSAAGLMWSIVVVFGSARLTRRATLQTKLIVSVISIVAVLGVIALIYVRLRNDGWIS